MQQYLEQGGCYVIMTRADDTALAEGKQGDLKGRTDIVNTAEGDLLISIHQNSYPSESVNGPQVFYFKESEESKALAEDIQTQMVEFLNVKKKRTAKANDDYYMLKQTLMPAVIVECGFLSNPEERSILQDEKYQQKVAWAVYSGIVNYINK